jgi:hypothetical protein
VFEHHLEVGKQAERRLEHPVDEHRFPVEHVDLGVGHLAVHLQHHADALERLQHRVDAPDVGDAVRRIGGGVRGVELAAGHRAARETLGDVARSGGVGQVDRHQRLEVEAGRQGAQDPGAVGVRLVGGDDRRRQVGHHDRPAELARREAQHVGQHPAVAQVHVPVVRLADGQPGGGDVLVLVGQRRPRPVRGARRTVAPGPPAVKRAAPCVRCSFP